MISNLKWSMCWLIILGGITHGQTSVISLETTQSTTISPAGQITTEAFIDQVLSPDSLRGYQVTIEIVPQAGTTGTMTLADPIPTSSEHTNLSIFVDTSRADWVYAGAPVGSSIIAGGNSNFLVLGAAIILNAPSVSFTTPKYAGTFIFLASNDAEGAFDINILSEPIGILVPTFLQDPDGANLSFTATGITINVIPQASNDICLSSLEIFNGITPFSTANSTTDGPDHPGSGCDVAGSSTVSNDIWYDYTATCTGQLTVSTCGSADFDTRVAIYDGCACPASSLIECNDDAVGCGTTSELINNVISGACYKIRVGGTLGATGAGNITVACVANDVCADAEPVVPSSSVQGATVNATVDLGLPACGPAIDSPGVWYTITGDGGLMSASLCGASSYDSRITVFQGTCGGFSCVTDANDTCGNRESVDWCSSAGTPYFILVHGNGGAEGTFTLNVNSLSCDDGNLCTNDSCNIDTCVNAPNFDVNTLCCNPVDRALTTIDDGNPCTSGTCNPFTGGVTQSPLPDGPETSCGDNLLCTLDECISGACANTDINTITCSNDGQCPGETTCDTGASLCTCAPSATMDLTADASTLPISTCYQNGDIITLRINMGPAAVPITGAQFFLEYDAGLLDFIDITEGSFIDPASPFSSELNRNVDDTLGTIDYSVTVGFGDPGTTVATTLAFARFSVVRGCQPFIRFRARADNEPQNIFIAENVGSVVPDSLIDLIPISTDVLPPLLSVCPADTLVSPDAGSFNAVVTWATPTATDGCDITVPVVCNPPSGFAFLPGTTTVTCSSVNSCGLEDLCTFDITVQGSVLSADVELSASVNFGPLDRCVTFNLFDCVGGINATFDEDMTFTAGLASNQFAIPGGSWDCITVKDPLHTLRSTSPDFATLDGVNYTASFIGNRATGGHWLVGGNLNNDSFIDILDFSVFMTQFLTPASPDTPCGTPSPDANINGDNVVDLVDFVFVQVNSLMKSELNCCGLAASMAQPLSEVSIAQLRRMGLYHMRHADLNRDGMIDVDDMIAFINGARPTKEYIPNASSPRRNTRN